MQAAYCTIKQCPIHSITHVQYSTSTQPLSHTQRKYVCICYSYTYTYNSIGRPLEALSKLSTLPYSASGRFTDPVVKQWVSELEEMRKQNLSIGAHEPPTNTTASWLCIYFSVMRNVNGHQCTSHMDWLQLCCIKCTHIQCHVCTYYWVIPPSL